MAKKRWDSKTSFNTCSGSTESFNEFKDCFHAGNYHGNYEEPIFTNDVLAQEKMIPLTSSAFENITPIKYECASRTSFNQVNVRTNRNVSICSFKECCRPEDCTHIHPQNVKTTYSYLPSEVKDDNIFNPTAKTCFTSETLRTEAPPAETRANDETSISTSSAADNPSDNGFFTRFLVNKCGLTKVKQREEEMDSQNTIILRKYTVAPSKDVSAEGVLSKKEMKKAEKERLKQEQKQKKGEQKMGKVGKKRLIAARFGF